MIVYNKCNVQRLNVSLNEWSTVAWFLFFNRWFGRWSTHSYGLRWWKYCLSEDRVHSQSYGSLDEKWIHFIHHQDGNRHPEGNSVMHHIWKKPLLFECTIKGLSISISCPSDEWYIYVLVIWMLASLFPLLFFEQTYEFIPIRCSKREMIVLGVAERIYPFLPRIYPHESWTGANPSSRYHIYMWCRYAYISIIQSSERKKYKHICIGLSSYVFLSLSVRIFRL